MSAVLLGGFIAERKAFAFNSLAAAATLILWWDTNELFAVGFQLSFSVVAAILLLQEPTFRFLSRRFAPDPFMPRSLFTPRRRTLNNCLVWLARASSVSFAAWIGSLPLMIWYAAEPLAAKDMTHSVEFMKQARIPLLREFMSRRLAALASPK